MIYDAENAFIFNEDVSSTPKVISNGEGGNAYDELFLTAKFAKPLETEATVTLKTDDVEAMTSAKTLCTLTIPVGAQHGCIRVPYGGKKFYTVAVSGPTSGKCTVALTLDGELD